MKRALKATLETVLPWAERLSGFQTARGDYLRNRLRMLTGSYEAEEIELMREFLRPQQVIVDVGAHVGYLTRFFGEATGAQGKVYAFEPNPVIFPLLVGNLAHLKQVSVFNFGLSSKADTFPLFLAGNNYSVASFAKKYPATHLAFHGNSEVDLVQAKVVAGDEFLRQEGIEHVDLIKIDVEGWELNVLSGLEKTIAASKGVTIFCELNPAAQECAGREPQQIIDWLFDRQFALFYPFEGKLRSLVRGSVDEVASNLGPKGYTTIFAHHR